MTISRLIFRELFSNLSNGLYIVYPSITITYAFVIVSIEGAYSKPTSVSKSDPAS